MIGYVDSQLRALLRIPVSASGDRAQSEIRAWIDTAFNGGLVLPRNQVSDLGLEKESSVEAVLADGSVVELETFACIIEWFGQTFKTQFISNDGDCPLLGTMLLDGRRLNIDFKKMTVELE